MSKELILLICILALGFSCKNQKTQKNSSEDVVRPQKSKEVSTPDVLNQELVVSAKYSAIHILVALCDNKYQGIVPVPKAIGNGQDPRNNLYWGAAYGIKTYFKRSDEWELVKSYSNLDVVLERLVFKHFQKDIYLVADAYNGKYIKQTTKDFLAYSSGNKKDVIEIEEELIGIAGHADLIGYIGHDGLMDFQLNEQYPNKDGVERDVIVLACFSKSYFEPHLDEANVNPLVWTTGLMAPEAYTIHDALSGYINGETNQQIATRAAQAYSKYQKCSLSAAKRLLVTD